MEIFDMTEASRNSGFAPFDSNIEAGGKVKSILLKGHEHDISRKEFDKLAECVKTYKAKGLMWFALGADGTVRSSYANKLAPEALERIKSASHIENGDVLFTVADVNEETALTAIGALRLELARKFDMIPKGVYAISWVTDFPMFEYDEEEQRFVAKHHPFTSPKDEDLGLVKTDPAKARAKAYDLVINGEEAGGGSLRIYDREIQKTMFEAIGMTDEQIQERFGFFVDAFKFGTPPHGGLAFGFDRLMMLLLETENIKDVIAFPKIQNASCMMTQAPTEVDEKQLRELYLMYHDYSKDKENK